MRLGSAGLVRAVLPEPACAVPSVLEYYGSHKQDPCVRRRSASRDGLGTTVDCDGNMRGCL